MSVLVDKEIKKLSSGELSQPLIAPFSERSLQGASYDLRLGAQYSKQGLVRTLTDEDPTLVLEPGEFALLSSLERLTLPLSMIGHNGIMSPWAKRGLVSLFSPQIDPGFAGILIVPVFNAGDADVAILLGEEIFTVEFVRTRYAASYSWAERYGEQLRFRNLMAPATSRPSLSDLTTLRQEFIDIKEEFVAIVGKQREVEIRLEELSKVRGLRLSWWSVMLAALAIVLAIVLALEPDLGDALKESISGIFNGA